MNDTIVVKRSTLAELIDIARQVWSQGLPMTDAQRQAVREAAIPMMAPRYGENVDNLLGWLDVEAVQLAFDFGPEFGAADRSLAERLVSEEAELLANAQAIEPAITEGPRYEQLQFDFGA